MKDWFLLFRPWSYTATLVPFLVGGALATGCNPECLSHPWLRWGLGFLSGLLFQATVNLLNTWGDERSGVDAVPGAIRTTPQVHEGKVSMRALLAVALACLVGAAAIGLALCLYEVPPWAYRFCDAPPDGVDLGFCWTLLAAGILGALGSINYSTGIKFKYHGLGVPFVSFLMGPLEILVAFAVAAPYMADRLVGRVLMSLCLTPCDALGLVAFASSVGVFLLLSAPVALLVGVIMHGNDMRDIPTDRAAGIVTFASWLGPRKALAYYRLCHVVPYVLVAAGGIFFDRARWLLLPCLALPLSVRTVCAANRVYRENPESPKWRGLERASGKVHLVFGVLYALALACMLKG